ncbi:ankyrin repeat-containing domain protein [Lactarius akahatsu]|uniref:Ankyrin repeat-containing domain protein n=1 Tax=Lactarius akahatsu TaxID=416441 RepID=A0AAD4L5X1_9AGAM|nr:ankyrin repeat-containing domain protein [Lactarius akahatsu]
MTLSRASLGVLLRLEDRVDSWSARKIPLVEYAAKYWVSHSRVGNVSSHMMARMKTLFDPDKPHFAAWVRVYDIDEPIRPYLRRYYLVKKHPRHINAIGGKNDYPLVAALSQGHFQIAELLFQHGHDIRTPLHIAIGWTNDLAVGAARFLLKHDADVNAQNIDLMTPLHLAAAREKFEVAQMLLQRGADVNSQNLGGETPLHLVAGSTSQWNDGHRSNHGADDETPLHNASLTWNVDVAQVLLNHGAYVNAENNQGQTPFHRLGLSTNNYYFQDVFYLGDLVNVAQLLVEHGADVNTRDRAHKTPLHLASYDLCLDSTLVLLDHGANVNAKDSRVSQSQGFSHNSHNRVPRDEDNNTPLHLASCYLHHGLVRALLDLGANVNAKNSRVSSQSQQSDSESEDIERGADVNTPDEDHETPLHLASLRLGPKSVRVLLDHGANLNAKNSHAISPRDSYFGAAQLLLERDADVDARDNTHETPLHLACRESYFGLVQILLDRGADVHAENSQGQTPFHQVFQYEYNTEGRVEHGVDVNTRDKDNETPLHLASRKVNLELAWVLLEHSANVNAKDNQGRTPLHHVSHLASQSYYHQYHESHFRIAQLLLERDKDHNTPLHSASYFLGLDFVWELLDHGASVNAGDNGGRTPLHRVLEYRDHYPYKDGFDVSQLLMERGADVNAANTDGETPLHLASRLVSLEVAWILLRDGADLNVENKEGKIPFQLVRESMREEMKRSPSEYPIRRARRAQGVALMGLLYGY